MPGHDRPTRASRASGGAFLAALALAVTLAAWFVVLAGPGLQPAQAVALGVAATATAATLLALTVAASRSVLGSPALRRARPGTPHERVEAPTPFWCAVEVSHRPSWPRAPGGR